MRLFDVGLINEQNSKWIEWIKFWYMINATIIGI